MGAKAGRDDSARTRLTVESRCGGIGIRPIPSLTIVGKGSLLAFLSFRRLFFRHRFGRLLLRFFPLIFAFAHGMPPLWCPTAASDVNAGRMVAEPARDRKRPPWFRLGVSNEATASRNLLFGHCDTDPFGRVASRRREHKEGPRLV